MNGGGVFICIRGFSSWPKFVAVVVGWTAVCLSHGSIQKAKAELWKMEQGKSGLKGNRGRDSIRQKTGLWGVILARGRWVPILSLSMLQRHLPSYPRDDIGTPIADGCIAASKAAASAASAVCVMKAMQRAVWGVSYGGRRDLKVKCSTNHHHRVWAPLIYICSDGR